MAMQQQNIKPAVVLDDDKSWATNIARGIRRFGGLPVRYFSSIEAFYKHHKIEYGDNIGLSNVLKKYSVITSDNNFEGATGYGGISGADFLLEQLGPALKEIDIKERPIVMCFAPSSQSVLARYETAMWEEYGIVSFHKLWENAAIGIAVRIAREYGVLLSRESVIHNICQQDVEEDNYEGPKNQFFFKLRADHLDFEDFPGEDYEQVSGKAKPMAWGEIVLYLAKSLNTTNEVLLETINHEVQLRRSQIEGQRGSHPEKEN